MNVPNWVRCEVCHEMAEIVQNVHIDDSGNRIEWSKVANKPDGIYFTISCPICGVREQRLVRYGDTD